MGVAELRASFNSISQPKFTCTLALLDYGIDREVEFQYLRFRGMAADGTQFEIASDPLRAGTDVNEAAKAVAQRLLDQREASP